MKRFATGLFVTGSLVAGAAACAHNGFAPIAVTKDAAVVAKCQSMGEVKVASDTPAEEIQRDLTREVRNKGANTLLVQSDASVEGSAYLCDMPALAASSHGTTSGSK
jgi:hypothetical protein